jgi:23S rRNA pseudouridine1911/1915/1917 synthase
VRPGGEVLIAFTPVVEEVRDVAIPVLARGLAWLAVDKPAGIPVHPVNRVRENTIIRMLRRQEGLETLRLCHRLDRETTGVLLIAADAPTARALATAFQHGRVAKEYLAIVHGEVEAGAGEIDLPIGEALRSKVYVRREPCAAGESAFTAWRVERRLAGRTLLRVFPRTGRRHQIRVHLAAIGHPIVGDLLYGRSDTDYLDLVRGVGDVRRGSGAALRQMLHSARLLFPLEGAAAVVVEAPLPADMIEELASAPGVRPGPGVR